MSYVWLRYKESIIEYSLQAELMSDSLKFRFSWEKSDFLFFKGWYLVCFMFILTEALKIPFFLQTEKHTHVLHITY